MFVEDREPDSILCHHGTGEDHVTSTCDVPVSETKVGSRCLNYVCIALLKMYPLSGDKGYLIITLSKKIVS